MSLFEYRFYDVMPGRLGEEVQRMHDVAIKPWDADGKSLFDRFGIPRPLGAWTTVAGRNTPVFGYLLEWESLAQRDAAFLPFWMSPEWAEFSAQTDDGRQMVERIDTWLLAPNRAWDRRPRPDAKPLGGLHEMRIHHSLAGYTPDVNQYLVEVEHEQMRVFGAEIIGVFDVAIGPDMPATISFIAWPDFAAQQQAARRLDVEPRVLARHRQWQAEHGRSIIRSVEQTLLRPLDYGTPMPDFGVIS